MQLNFGIGITNPAGKLEIVGTANDTPSETNATLNLRANNQGGGLILGTQANWPVGAWIQTTVNGAVGGTPLLLQPITGNVGIGAGTVANAKLSIAKIGTTTSAAKLDVAGGIRPGNTGVTTGGACTPEGTFAYDLAAHAPVYCKNTLLWTAMGGGFTTCVVAASAWMVARVACPAGYTLTGDGGNGGGTGNFYSMPSVGNGWQCNYSTMNA